MTTETQTESEQMQEKVEAAEKLQIVMKAGNKIIRSKKLTEDEKAKKLINELDMSQNEVIKVLTPDWYGDVGYAPYRLTNNNANIRRMKQRVKALKAKENTATSELRFDGGVIIDNAEADRVQIDFGGKPSDSVREALNRAGWRWTPTLVLWQRKRTPAAMYSAKAITGVV